MKYDYIVTRNSWGGYSLAHRYKYLKREWKNGRWNYTYPSNSKSYRTDMDINNKFASAYQESVNRYYKDKYAPLSIYNNNSPEWLRDSYRDDVKEIRKSAMAERYTYLKNEAATARQMRDQIEKWNKSPVTKILTLANKGRDLFKSLIAKWKKPRNYTINSK